MTPSEQDKELREAIEDLISQVGNYWFCVAKETSDSRTLSEGEAMKQIMQLITADRKRVVLEARIEAYENAKNYVVGFNRNTVEWIEDDITKLKAQQEEV